MGETAPGSFSFSRFVHFWIMILSWPRMFPPGFYDGHKNAANDTPAHGFCLNYGASHSEPLVWEDRAAGRTDLWRWSHDVELADRRPLLAAVLVKPLPLGGPRQDGAVLGHAPVGLTGPGVGRVPVRVGDGEARLVRPGALGHHVVDAQPDLLVRAHALPEVLPELGVLVGGRGRAEDAAQGVAVIAGGVVALLHGVGQVALPVDLRAF